MTNHASDAGADCPCICPHCRDTARGHCLGVYCAHQQSPRDAALPRGRN